ncbi:MAG: hypothetical protein ABSA66_15735 [Roseiarcus sp.]|jgi:hypothetical protein
MVAPVVAVIVGLFTGASIPAGALVALGLPHAETLVVVDAAASKVYVDLPALCAATQGPIDALASARKTDLALRLARAGDALCASASRPNTPANRLRAAAAWADALVAAGAAPPAPAPAPAVVHKR